MKISEDAGADFGDLLGVAELGVRDDQGVHKGIAFVPPAQVNSGTAFHKHSSCARTAFKAALPSGVRR